MYLRSPMFPQQSHVPRGGVAHVNIQLILRVLQRMGFTPFIAGHLGQN